MRKYVPENFIRCLRINKHRYYISVFWILGLLTGSIFAKTNSWESISFTAIEDSIFTAASGVLVMILPLLFGAAVCAVSLPSLYVFLFLKGFVYAFVFANISVAFCDAAWLMRSLLLFTDTIMVIVFLIFSLRSAGQGRNTFKRNATVLVIAMVVIIAFYLYFVIPLTTLLLNG